MATFYGCVLDVGVLGCQPDQEIESFTLQSCQGISTYDGVEEACSPFAVGDCCLNDHQSGHCDPQIIGTGCNPALPDCDLEICDNNMDDDCDGTVDEGTSFGQCRAREICCNEKDDNGDGGIDEGCGETQCCDDCRGTGKPVDLFNRQMTVGPETIAHTRTDLGGSADLKFDVAYDSKLARLDFQLYGTGSGGVAPLALGIGFRHSFDQRLVLRGSDLVNPELVEWQSINGMVTFYRDGSNTSWRSEPGLAHLLRKSGAGTWRLLTEGGDVLEFVEHTVTQMHPATSVAKEVRLKNIFPGGALNRRIALLYEEDPQGTSFGDQIPPLACDGPDDDDLVVGSPNPTCVDSGTLRGLLVKIGIVLDGAARQHGASFELRYAYTAGGGSAKDHYQIAKVRSGTDRIDGESISDFATLSYTAAYPPRLELVTNKLFCTVANDSCTIAKYSYAAGTNNKWALSDVDRPAVNASGVLEMRQDEDFVWNNNSSPAVDLHRSLGLVVSTTTSPGTPTMTWTRNGVAQTWTFEDGKTINCSGGMCGDASSENVWAKSTAIPGYTLGLEASMREDGICVSRDLNDKGQAELECEIVPNAGQACGYPGAYCSLALGTAATGSSVSFNNGTLRRVERRYYSSIGRLQARAVYDPETTNAALKFPHPADTVINWFTPGLLSSACPSLTTQRTTFGDGLTHSYDVTVWDVNSDGNTTLNELGSTDLTTRPDELVVRINRRAQLGNGPISSTCDVFERSARGDITRVRRYFDGTQRYTTDLGYFTVPQTKKRASGRLSSIVRYRTMPTSSALTVMNACTSPVAYDDEGRLTCHELPQSVSPNIRIEETASAGDGKFAFRRVTTRSDLGTNTFVTYQKALAWGAIYESGIGDGASGGKAEGNATRRTFYSGAADAASGLLPGDTRRINSATTPGDVWKRQVFAANNFGQITMTKVFDAYGTLTSQVSRVPDVDDQTITLEQGIAGQGYALSTFTYEPWGAVETHVEGDHVPFTNDQTVTNVYGTGGNTAGRLYEVRRGQPPGTAQQRFSYTRDGLTKEIYNAPLSGSTAVGVYTYDALRRLISESRNTVGQTVKYVYFDDARVRDRRSVSPGGTEYERVATLYDGLGRPLQMTVAGGSTVLRTFKYDTKGTPYLGTAVPGHTTVLSDKFSAGRLVYEEGDSVATFYEYDLAGRITSIVWHDGPLSAFNGANLTSIDFAYNTSGTQELSSITYPSGRVVTYTYFDDKDQPWGVAVTGMTPNPVIGQIKYHPSGAPAAWRWASDSARDRIVLRDLLGRVTEIQDEYAGVEWSDVFYTYDGDGDVLVENDTSLSTQSRTWLIAASTGNQTRNYGYEPTKDFLKSWQDDGLSESIIYLGSGRRGSETDNGTTYTYSWDSTYPERLNSKFNNSVSNTHERVLTYENAGLPYPRVSQIKWSDHTSADVTLAYSHLGNVVSRTNFQGAHTDNFDAQMRRFRTTYPTGTIRTLRYAFGREPLEEKSIASGSTSTWETLFVAGERFAQIAKYPSAGPTIYNLHTDRMGIPRKAATTTGTIVKRLIMDPWGASSSASGDVVTDNAVSPSPALNARYPGQYADAVFFQTQNGWRNYLPEIGQYTAPEPLHSIAASELYGPQAYGYVASRPLLYVDPSGLNREDGIWNNPPTEQDIRDCRRRYDSYDYGEGEDTVDRRWACTRAHNDGVGGHCDDEPADFDCGCARWYEQTQCPRVIPAGDGMCQ